MKIQNPHKITNQEKEIIQTRPIHGEAPYCEIIASLVAFRHKKTIMNKYVQRATLECMIQINPNYQVMPVDWNPR